MPNEIVFAADPFSDFEVAPTKALKSLNVVASSLSSSILVAAVISPDRIKTPFNFDDEDLEKFADTGRAWLEKWAAKNKMTSAQLSILVQPLQSSGKSVSKLTDYVEKKSARALAVATHLKKRPTFTLTGSFTSQLLEKSNVPVLALDARAKPIVRVSKILFATDFSTRNKPAFNTAVEWAKDLGAELIILNVLLGMPNHVVGGESLAGGIPNIERYLTAQRQDAENCSAAWAKIAVKKGVRTTVVLKESPFPVSKVIHKVADSKSADLIILSSNTSAKGSLLFGSVTRDVLKRGGRPILVVK